MKYLGIRPTSYIPDNAVSTELAYERTHKGETVKYWHVWGPDTDQVKPIFNPETLSKGKIKDLDNDLSSGFFTDEWL